ncbi:uncharacterized protein [Ptychodera flava]|uniref:uncharacterized protein n=1 Tax=Ptychodera flava TaxID=63121 RepID=UPI00396AAA05
MDKRSVKFKAEVESYELHFHARAHYVSADYYETLDRRLTYLKVACAAFGTAFGGKAIYEYIEWSEEQPDGRQGSSKAMMLAIASFGAAAITQLYTTGQAPSQKQKFHNEAAAQMKALRKKVQAWSDTIPETETVEQKDRLRKQYEEYIDEHCKIDNLIKSEDWTFSEVHDTLPKGWKDKGRELGMYIPKRDIWYYFQKYKKIAEPYLQITIGVMAVIGLWKYISEGDGK